MDLDHPEELAREHGATEFYRDVEGLVGSENIDAVYITTPHHLHCEHTLAAARRGKHVLCEKPMATTLEDCRRMVDACRDNGVTLAIGYMKRFDAYHRKAKELVDSGALGRITEARAQIVAWTTYPDPNHWRLDPAKSGGGVMVSLGCHAVDLLCYLLGDVADVTAVTGHHTVDPPGAATEDRAIVIMGFENGAYGIVDTSYAIPFRKNTLEIYGTEGSILAERTLGPFVSPTMELHQATGITRFDIPWVDPYAAEFEHFGECIAKGETPLADGWAGLQTTAVILATYESAESGRTVKLRV
jgi:predicted dehydrogenase